MTRITIDGTISQFSCKMTVPSNLWDTKTKRLIDKSTLAVKTNLALDKIRADITWTRKGGAIACLKYWKTSFNFHYLWVRISFIISLHFKNEIFLLLFKIYIFQITNNVCHLADVIFFIYLAKKTWHKSRNSQR